MDEEQFTAQAKEIIAKASAAPPGPVMNEGQKWAVGEILLHLTAKDGVPFIVLEGPAGTGKTFCTKQIIDQFKQKTVFTAPTNKAVRVLRDALKSDTYRPQCLTIYSLLGLKMQPDGEIKVLAKPEEEVDLSDLSAVFVDECGMIGEGLWDYILAASKDHPGLRWVFMGDPWQLPPVKEQSSPVWGLENRIELTEVMRAKNQILETATFLREQIAKPFRDLTFPANNDGEQGVWRLRGGILLDTIRRNAGDFTNPGVKAIAWRNVTVEAMNRAVRAELFENSTESPWFVGDRITLLEPAKDQTADKTINRIVGITDEEGTIEQVSLMEHPVYKEFTCWRIVMRSDTNQMLTLWALHGKELNQYTSRKGRLASEAKMDKRRWREYWEFCEAFHSIRHAYATTAHRAQGSTYTRAFVDFADIMRNQNRAEALRCLYVAASRPKIQLYLG